MDLSSSKTLGGSRRFRRRLGQHMLNSESIVDSLVESCGLSPRSRVLEIGTGTGVLTKKLAKKAGHVVSFEVDRSLFELSKTALSGFENVQLILGDVFAHDISNEKFDVCVTSLPYSESLRFVKWISIRSNVFSSSSVILQSEFAEKLRSSPGTRPYRAVSVIAQISLQIEHLFDIERNQFNPPPLVNSEAIRLSPNPNFKQPFFDRKKMEVLDYIFSFRGRHLSSAMKKMGKQSQIMNFPAELLSSRIEMIPPEDYARIIS
jgi:16S rRNA (adenine1518-N6/adenine1519-N6)-dimethyltransferase